MNQEKFYGLSIIEVLGISFVILKLCGVIKWSWVWVLAPFWLQIVFLVVLVLIIRGMDR